MLISPEKERQGNYEQMCSVNDPESFWADSLCTHQRLELIFMSDLIPTNKRARKTWLAGLSQHLTASNVGFAFLSAQITDLEQRCAAMRSRINRKRPERTPPSRAYPV